jgi:hypothetical protein
MKPVNSSNVSHVGYNSATNVLSVQFKSGKKIYQYQGVPPELHDNLMKADSIGTYISKMVVGKFNHTTKEIQ